MADNIRVQDWTKDQLDAIIDTEDHSPYDSAIKSLLKDHNTVQHMTAYDTPNRRGASDHPLTATDPLPRESVAGIWGPEVYLGTIGSGKTVTAAHQIYQHLDSDLQTTVFVIDPLGQYKLLADTHEGTHVVVENMDDLEHRTPSNRLLVCDLREMSEDDPDPALFESVVTELSEQAKSVEGRALFLIDEGHLFLQSETLVRSLKRIVRHGRKFGVSFRLVSMDIEDIDDFFVANATRVYLHAYPGLGDERADRLRLTTSEREYVREAATGGTTDYAEILVRDGSTGWQPFRVDIPDDVLNRIVGNPVSFPDSQ